MRTFGPADLADATRFRLLDTLEHDDMLPFLQQYYSRRRTWLTVVHYLLTVGAGVALALAGFAGGYSLSGWLLSAVLGVIAFFVVLLPVHEGLHAIVYWALGARGLRAFFLRRYLAVYVVAHNFVVDGRELAALALAPFVVISTTLLALAFIGFPDRVAVLAALGLHTAGTSGDWALMNYLWVHRGRQVLTYDDAELGATYFFERIDRGPPSPDPNQWHTTSLP
jgi:hypothetical protein